MTTINIQYKGTDTCLDFSCACGAFNHYCTRSPFSGAVRCMGCDQVWILSPRIEVRLADSREDDQWRIAHAVEDTHVDIEDLFDE